MAIRRVLVTALAGVAALAAAPAANAARSLRSGDLLTITGIGPHDRLGSSVAGAGDVNGDGIPDIVVGAPGAAGGRGAAYVVFGSRQRKVVRVSHLGRNGFQIVPAAGALSHDALGASVAGAGDVNGDGLADVVVGAPEADPLGRRNVGAAYVVFGKRSTSRVRLDSLGSGGYEIEGAGPSADHTGSAVANAGDLGGDGRPDVLVSAPGLVINPSTGLTSGVYAVYGKPGSEPVDLRTLGSAAGFLISGPDAGMIGPAVAGIGDVNGDHRPDIGAGFDLPFNDGAGGAFFMFGGARAGTVSIDDSGVGFGIIGRFSVSFVGSALTAAGDADRDGLGDVLVGAPLEGCLPQFCDRGTPRQSQRELAGGVYLVLGQSAGVPLSDASLTQSFHFAGARNGGELGSSLARIGDVNGDRVQDFAFGAPGPGSNLRFHGNRSRFAGAVWIVYGSRNPRSLDLAHAGRRAFELRGQPRDRAGTSLDRVGDMNRDRRPDIVVGAPGASHGRGAVYVVTP